MQELRELRKQNPDLEQFESEFKVSSTEQKGKFYIE